MRVVIPIPVCEPQAHQQLWIVRIVLNGSFNLINSRRRLLVGLSRCEHGTTSGENKEGPSERGVVAVHWLGSSSRSCNRELDSSSARRDLAISRRFSASSFFPIL